MTNFYDTIDVAHLVVVVYDEAGSTDSDFDRTAERYRAECSCGWCGDWHDEGALAEADGDDHREMIVGPADAVDRLISGLLDLQDDLARAVMWLAEHWSTDLPAPAASGHGDPPSVRMIAYCLSVDELERAADTLGAPLVDDPAPDSSGNRYRRAARDFGRVTLEAYRLLGALCDECGTALAGEACPVCGQHADARPVTLEVA